ncbi:MAG: Ni/Fe hydrogenase subunit alpha [archaeon]
MHTQDLDITLKSISKIEGHTGLDLKTRNGKVVECKLKIDEGKRFFAKAIEGKQFNQVPTIMSRICGTCSSAHTLCSIEAVEKALGINVSMQTQILRDLLSNAGHLRDHAMHLYFFCLPDLFNKDSVLDFTGKEKDYIHDGLHIKDAGNYLSTIIGGRAVHPPNAVIGGFTKFPNKEEVETAKKKLRECRKRILKILELFYKDKSTFKRKTNYVAMVSDDYNYLRGYIKTARGSSIPEEQYGEHLKRVVLPYSTARAFEWESEDYMVGAMARLNLNKEALNKKTTKACEKYLNVFPTDCIFNNNLAQGIEMMQEIDDSLDKLNNIDIKPEKPIIPKPKKGTGIGVVEAPRGTLYYHLDLDKKGIVTHCDLCIPTQQNIIHLEKDIASYVEQMLKEGKGQKKIEMEIEKMIRAYDPCMSCATHFLKVRWK